MKVSRKKIVKLDSLLVPLILYSFFNNFSSWGLELAEMKLQYEDGDDENADDDLSNGKDDGEIK